MVKELKSQRTMQYRLVNIHWQDKQKQQLQFQLLGTEQNNQNENVLNEKLFSKQNVKSSCTSF